MHVWPPAGGGLSPYSDGSSKVKNKDSNIKLLGCCAPGPFELGTPEHMLCIALHISYAFCTV